MQGVVEGLADVIKTLDGLPDKLQRKIMRPALMRATKGTVAAAKRLCRSKVIRKSIGRKVVTVGPEGNKTLIVIIGPRRGYAVMVRRSGGRMVKEDPVNIAHFLEFGTKSHSLSKGASTRKDGRQATARPSARMHPGTAAQPFLRPAFDSTKADIERIFADEVAAGLARELAKR